MWNRPRLRVTGTFGSAAWPAWRRPGGARGCWSLRTRPPIRSWCNHCFALPVRGLTPGNDDTGKDLEMTVTMTTAAAALIHRPAVSLTVSAGTSYPAAPLDQVNAWVAQWGTSLQILGGTILAICMVLV